MTRRPGIAEILAAAEIDQDGLRAVIPAGWMQGRTSYGGLSSALALHAAQASEADLPPLRSAQIAFIGPLAGEVRATATRLRRGRTAAFVQSDISTAAGLGLRATFVFMSDQASRIELAADVSSLRPPGSNAELYTGPEGFFTSNFHCLDLKEAASGPAEWVRWVRLRDFARIDPMVELMAVGDALPPAALKLLGKEFVPLSSLTWQIDVLTPTPTTEGGWWLLSSRADHARNGCSSQRMTVRNARGELVAEGMQGVALFG